MRRNPQIIYVWLCHYRSERNNINQESLQSTHKNTEKKTKTNFMSMTFELCASSGSTPLLP